MQAINVQIIIQVYVLKWNMQNHYNTVPYLDDVKFDVLIIVVKIFTVQLQLWVISFQKFLEMIYAPLQILMALKHA